MSQTAEVVLEDNRELINAFRQLNELIGRNPNHKIPMPWETGKVTEFIRICVGEKLWLLADRLLTELARRGPLTGEQSGLALRVRNFTATIFVQVPQIQPNSPLGGAIQQYVHDIRPKTILDVGAATGLGSTLAFANAAAQLSDCTIYAMEAEPVTFELLKNNATGMRRVRAVSGSLITDLVVPAWTELQEDIARRSNVLQIYAEEEVRHWYTHGVDQLRAHRLGGRAPWPDLPQSIDIAMIDADLFFAREELAAILDRTAFVFLDDICAYKNTFNHEMLANSADWQLIAHHPNDRHGWSAFKRKSG